MCNVAFEAVAGPFFLYFIQKLRPLYHPPREKSRGGSNIVKGIRAATPNCKTSFRDASHYWTKHNRYNKDLENARSAANVADTAEVPEATSNATEAAEIGTA
ncbi:hypothetical protein WJX84_008814 [Apatococcus fuscideae]|uniref:Uncharacterized protein n=1 Tax=Apatococcus fuscideae TaxID=2026836 RepID=A0AAW1RVB5_9CHLO